MRNSLINFHTRAAGGGLNPAESSQASTKDRIAVPLVGINHEIARFAKTSWIALGARKVAKVIADLDALGGGVNYVAKNFFRVFSPADRSGDFPRGKFRE